MPGLVLGPIVRYVDERVATIWLQAEAACEVEVLGVRERTWCVEGLYFALVAVEGLAVGEDHRYQVRLDGELAWPEPGSAFPASTIRLLDARGRRDIVFGSCRTTRPHEPPYALRASEHEAGQGIDALRAYALRVARAGGGAACPDMLLMLGDQIYADQPSPALQEVLAGRERPAGVPADELADFCEYALAYGEAYRNGVGDRPWSGLGRRLRRHYRSGPSQLQYPLNGSRDVRERHLNGESLRPFADREKRADPSGVDEPDFSEVEYEPANSVLGKEPLDLGLEHERRGHVELAAGLDLDRCTVTP